MYSLHLQPENLLLDSRTAQLKIADFGLSGLSQMAAGVEGEQLLHTQCGSPNYCAPEILEPSSSRSGYNGALVDTWSVGVILYVLLAGRLPFYDPDPRRLYEAIATSVVQFPANFPEGAADIVRRLLVKEPTGRMSLEDVQKHPWYLVGLEPPARRRQRRSRPQSSSGSSNSSSNGSTSTSAPTIEAVGDETVQAMPPRSSLPTSTLGSSSRRLDDVDPPESSSTDAASAGRVVPQAGVRPPRPMPESDSPEEVTVLARRNGWGDTYPRERRSSSPSRRDGHFVSNVGAGVNGISAKTDGEFGGAPRGGETHSPSSDGPVPAFDDKDLVEAPDADQRNVSHHTTGSICSTPASPSVEKKLAGQAPLSRSHSAGAISPASSRLMGSVRGPPGAARLAGRPPRPGDSPLVPIRDLDYTSPEGPTLSVVDDAELDREENELRFQNNHRPVRAASGGSVMDGASDRFSVAPSAEFDREVSMFSDALASSVISGTTSRPAPPTRAALPVTSIASTQFGNKFASGDAVPRDSAVTSNEPSSRGGDWRDSVGSGSGDTYRSGPRSLHTSPGVAKRAENRAVPAPPSLGAGGLASSSSGRTTPPSLAELNNQGRLSVGGTGQSVAWAQDDSRRGRAGVRSLLGLTGSNEPPSFVTALPARECLRTIGTILSDMRLTVFLKKNQNKMKCQVGLLRGLPMWASICYVESGGSELNSVVFKRAREDHSRFDHVYLEKLCNSVHTQYRHAVEMSAVRAAEAARDP